MGTPNDSGLGMASAWHDPWAALMMAGDASKKGRQVSTSFGSDREFQACGADRPAPAVAARMKRHFDASQRRTFPVTATVLGLTLTVREGVFAPDWYEDAEFFGTQLATLTPPGARVLEVGCGSGAVALSLAAGGAVVTAADVDPRAVASTVENAAANGVDVECLRSDVFENLGGRRFDLIFWNVPFSAMEVEPGAPISLFDPDHRALRTFLRDAPAHLLPGGRLFVGFSLSLGDGEHLNRVVAASGMSATRRVHTVDGHGESLDLFEIAPLGGR